MKSRELQCASVVAGEPDGSRCGTVARENLAGTGQGGQLKPGPVLLRRLRGMTGWGVRDRKATEDSTA